MIRIRAPGRICLFGEHQDYLGFPVISLAFSKYIFLEAEPISEIKFEIELPDIESSDEIILNNKELEYISNRDYLRSGYNQFIRLGAKFNKGFKIKITGDIPINAGCGSSSSLIIVWLYFLSSILNINLELHEIAKLGYHAEVEEFGEAGGMMDHYTSALGNLLFLQTHPEFVPTSYNINLENLVLANSQETKDTVDDLRRVKTRALEAFKIVKENMNNFDPYKTQIKEIEPYLPNLEKELQKILIGNLVNRNLTKIARRLIESYIQQTTEDKEKESIFYRQLGIFLNEHQNQLTENIGITTPKIDNMISKALENGAFGAKINGSGFGGCIFLLAPENKEGVMDAIKDAGGVVYDIETAEGVRFY